MRKIAFLLLYCCGITAAATAQTLFETLAAPDSVTGAFVVVHQDSVLQAALENAKSASQEKSVRGFRIQLFSSNNARTARDGAFRVENAVREALPNLSVYVTYAAPFWRVRVGNCATHEEAQRLRQYIMEKMPQYQAETYIVPDKILLNQ